MPYIYPLNSCRGRQVTVFCFTHLQYPPMCRPNFEFVDYKLMSCFSHGHLPEAGRKIQIELDTMMMEGGREVGTHGSKIARVTKF